METLWSSFDHLVRTIWWIRESKTIGLIIWADASPYALEQESWANARNTLDRSCNSYGYTLSSDGSTTHVRSPFDPPFGGVRGNVHTLFIARYKARGRLPIRDNRTFFASSYCWDVISRYWSKSSLFKGVSLWPQILGGRGRRSQPLLVSEN